MPRMLRHKPTGDLYVYTTLLFERGDMEIVDEEQEETPAVAEEKPKRARKAKAEAIHIEDVPEFSE